VANGKTVETKETLSNILSKDMQEQVKWLVTQMFYHLEDHQKIPKTIWVFFIGALTVISLVIGIYANIK